MLFAHCRSVFNGGKTSVFALKTVDLMLHSDQSALMNTS